MAFLGKALTVVGAIVGIAAAVATGGALGILAGAILAVGAASSLGLIGGSVGKFMNSGWGKGLMAVAALGTAAVAMYGQGAAQAGISAAQQADQAATLDATTQQAMAANTAAISDSTPIQTASAISNDAGTASTAAGLADNATAAAGAGGPAASVAQANPTGVVNMGASSEQAAQQGQQSLENAVGANGGGATGPGSGPGIGAAQKLQAPLSQDGGAGATGGAPVPGAAANPNDLTGVMPPGADQYKDMPQAGAGGSNAGGSSMWDKTKDFANTKAGSATIEAGGKMLGGVGQGMMENAAMQQQIKAQQWANLQWQNQSQVGQLESAAAAPIGVPQGYLQRAAAVRSLTAGNSGIQPVPPVPGPVHG